MISLAVQIVLTCLLLLKWHGYEEFSESYVDNALFLLEIGFWICAVFAVGIVLGLIYDKEPEYLAKLQEQQKKEKTLKPVKIIRKCFYLLNVFILGIMLGDFSFFIALGVTFVCSIVINKIIENQLSLNTYGSENTKIKGFDQ